MQIIQVHKVYPKQKNFTLNLVIIFFHGFVYGKNIAIQWKETWTSTPTNGKEHVFWPKKWLLEDMGYVVQILSLSYDANIYGINKDVT